MSICKKIVTGISLTLLAGTLNFSLPEFAQADPPPHAPAHGYRNKQKVQYKYMYYPQSQVYYSPTRNGYYYPSNGSYIFNAKLPSNIQLGKSVSIDLDGPDPVIYHPTVIQQYPVIVQ